MINEANTLDLDDLDDVQDLDIDSPEYEEPELESETITEEPENLLTNNNFYTCSAYQSFIKTNCSIHFFY